MLFGCPNPNLFTANIHDAKDLGYKFFGGLYLGSKVSGDLIVQSENLPDKPFPHFAMHLGCCPEETSRGSFAISKRWLVAYSGQANYIGEDHSRDNAGNIFTWALESFESVKPSTGHKEVLALNATLNRMQGSFAAFFYHFPSRQIFIYRTRAPLYYNSEHHAFCSIKSHEDFMLKPGTLYRWKDRSIIPLLKITIKKEASPNLPE